MKLVKSSLGLLADPIAAFILGLAVLVGLSAFNGETVMALGATAILVLAFIAAQLRRIVRLLDDQVKVQVTLAELLQQGNVINTAQGEGLSILSETVLLTLQRDLRKEKNDDKHGE